MIVGNSAYNIRKSRIHIHKNRHWQYRPVILCWNKGRAHYGFCLFQSKTENVSEAKNSTENTLKKSSPPHDRHSRIPHFLCITVPSSPVPTTFSK